MQSVRTVIKNLGVPPIPSLLVITPEQADQELQYNYTSQGYDLFDTHYLGAVPTPEGNGIAGYKFAYVFVKNDSEDPTVSEAVDGVEKKKLGRPAKVQ